MPLHDVWCLLTIVPQPWLLTGLWAEANPLERVALQTQLGSLQDAASLRELGLDWQQVTEA